MIEKILGAIGNILYPLFNIIFTLIDGIQGIFGKFAGIESVKAGGVTVNADNTGGLNDTGIVYYLFQSDIVKNMFYSILLLGIFLLIIFTVVAFIKNAYASKQKTWKDILGNTFIGLMNFIFVPAVCLLGVWLGNILLQAVNSATSSTGSSSMSGNLFVASAYNANKIRSYIDDHGWYETNDTGAKEEDLVSNHTDEIWNNAGKTCFDYLSGRYANFKSIITEDEAKKDPIAFASAIDSYYGQNGLYTSKGIVSKCYSIWNINYLVLAAGGIFLIYALAGISFGMVKRLFMLLMLFIISPAMCALYPIDDGNAVKRWKDEFIKNTLSAFGAVAGLNIFFAIIPLVNNIKIGGPLDVLGLTSVLLTIAGLFVVKDLISFISGAIGAGNAYADGSSLMKSTTGALKNARKKTGEFVKKGASKLGEMRGVKAAGGSAWRYLLQEGGRATMRSTLGFDDKELKDSFKKSKEEKREHWYDDYNKRRSAQQYGDARQRVERAINTARNEGRALTNEEMADVLGEIADKGAKERAAEAFLAYNNNFNTTQPGGNRRTTSLEKILDSEKKVVEEENARAGAYGANTSYSEVQRAMVGLDSRFYNNATHSLLTTTKIDPARLAQLEEKAKAVGATAFDMNAYNDAVTQNATIDKYTEIVREAKSSASQLAQSIISLAENYSNPVKPQIIDIANELRKSINGTDDLNVIDRAVTSTRTRIASIAGKGAELNNILNTGNR